MDVMTDKDYIKMRFAESDFPISDQRAEEVRLAIKRAMWTEEVLDFDVAIGRAIRYLRRQQHGE